ncbi:hypothetical protein LTR10_021291 [Elasticomyces elasticus]|uniref:Xylanolytic transcriptional activator regulatory domain-containing protein n=1 Tax=Exophiala sideris TaxID=1016849 RepID=A0ABR0JFC3_9EURO|nr:hypothetical protein LTR10_021291 [Elasticomyces elasticus]KAK5029130.1 hypothetical protein LTR13_008667 [Exophiala sideris]KAK5063383.1 hypothetical protein LTR69_004089 [Exophiala sideris]
MRSRKTASSKHKRNGAQEASTTVDHIVNLSNEDGAEFGFSPVHPGTILPAILAGDNASISDQAGCTRPPDLGTSTDALSTFIYNPAILGSGVELLDNVTSPAIDEFHNSSFLSRSAILGDDFPELDHTHPDRQTHEFTISETDLKVLQIHAVFDLPRLAVRQRLLEAVVEFCWTWMPVLDLDATPSRSGSAVSPKATSILLLQTLMLVGSYMTGGQHTSTPLQSHYRRVKAIVDSGVERNPYKLLAAVCLIQWCAPSAPKDISMDTPRFWNMYAISLAQQMGLHRKVLHPGKNEGLRKRIWWTLYARDSLTASAHGRPRLINIADCTVERPSTSDFSNPTDPRAQIFVSWVSICEILHDICLWLSAQPDATLLQKQDLASRLLEYIQDLPPELGIINPDGSARAYDFQLAQLHVTILTAITILYRPSSIFNIAPLSSSAISITASNLNVKLFEAIELRDHTHCLSSAFTWNMLVSAIPQLSALCCVPALATQAGHALDTIEDVLQTFSRVRTSAVNNLANVRAIRKAVSVPRSSHPDMHNGKRGQDRPDAHTTLEADGPDSMPFKLFDLLKPYGVSAVKNYESNLEALRVQSSSSPTEQDAVVPQSDTQAQIGQGPEFGDWTIPDENLVPPAGTNIDDSTSDFQLLVGDDFQESGWMRDWVDDLQLFGLDV